MSVEDEPRDEKGQWTAGGDAADGEKKEVEVKKFSKNGHHMMTAKNGKTYSLDFLGDKINNGEKLSDDVPPEVKEAASQRGRITGIKAARENAAPEQWTVKTHGETDKAYHVTVVDGPKRGTTAWLPKSHVTHLQGAMGPADVLHVLQWLAKKYPGTM
jgi:hypothetical protein